MSALNWPYLVVGVSLLVGLGAVALESMLRAAGRGGRWAWVGAVAVLLLLPASGWLRPALPALPAAVDMLALPLVLLPPVTAAAASPGVDPRLILWLGWALASALLLLLLFRSWVALRRAVRTWRATELEGVSLLVSQRTGPAVLGVRRPRIVVPEWVLELSGGERRLLVLHEQEHVRAGDARLMLFALGGCVLLPWNPVLWWALHRLRSAMELDCDGRVLRRSRDPAGYGRLLLEVGRRRSERYLLAAAFAEPRVLLERRVRALVHWPQARRPLLGLAAGAAALLCFGFAYVTAQPLARGQQPAAPGGPLSGGALDTPSFAMPSPPRLAVQDTPPPLSPKPTFTPVPVRPELRRSGLAVQDTPPPLGIKPTFTPMTVRPELRNVPEVQRLLMAEYPPLLRSAGIGAQPVVWLFIDQTGRVGEVQLSASSGYPALDSAALRVARQMEFTPAANRGVTVPVWVEVPIVFTAESRAAAQAGVPGVPGRSEAGDQLAVRDIANQAQVIQALAKVYPPLLRNAGIGGRSVLWFYVTEDGVVTKTQLAKGSGYPALDEAALKLADVFRFAPARAAGWVQVPIDFVPKE